MSLATRCTACGTIFRVVEDQLRVSEGWVRCGRCAEVFDAREQLFDIDRDTPPPWPPNPAPTATNTPPPPAFEEEVAADDWNEGAHADPQNRSPSSSPSTSSTWRADDEFEERPSYDAPRQHDELTEPSPEQRTSADSRFDSRLEPQWADEPSPDAVAPKAAVRRQEPARIEPPAIEMGDGPDVMLSPALQSASTGSAASADKVANPPPPASSAAAEATTAASVPEFLRPARGNSRWHRPTVRLGLFASALLLVSALGLQGALHFRDALAAQQPVLRPLLTSICQLAACELRDWQHIESISVETSALNQAGSGNHYKLLVGLRNKGKAAVATPWVELSMTDAAGNLLAKRTLRPSDLHSERTSMPPGSDLNLQALLTTGPLKVSGYSVEIFYP
ncbi:zinc-ribbon and DUF3426 domain-containing protein [Paucibacter sp. AS339]|uniref:zinc-ribbon and DUF3426 domain-containing protein n=1 Tax=Paucibacter hankyongi TaxID=3133434 RepID=UPI0030A0A2FA